MAKNSSSFLSGLQLGIPIFIGYFPAAVAFGLVARSAGLLFGDTVVFSMTTFAGASQFFAVNLLRSGALILEIALGVFLVNLRHVLFSASLYQKLSNPGRAQKAFIAFGNTDEVFSVASTREGKVTPAFMAGLEIPAWSGWVIGSAAGFLVGTVLPEDLQISVGITLYAMFTSLLIQEVKRSFRYLGIAALSGLINTVAVLILSIAPGWAFIISIAAAGGIGALILPEEDISGQEITEGHTYDS